MGGSAEHTGGQAKRLALMRDRSLNAPGPSIAQS